MSEHEVTLESLHYRLDNLERWQTDQNGDIRDANMRIKQTNERVERIEDKIDELSRGIHNILLAEISILASIVIALIAKLFS